MTGSISRFASTVPLLRSDSPDLPPRAGGILKDALRDMALKAVDPMTVAFFMIKSGAHSDRVAEYLKEAGFEDSKGIADFISKTPRGSSYSFDMPKTREKAFSDLGMKHFGVGFHQNGDFVVNVWGFGAWTIKHDTSEVRLWVADNDLGRAFTMSGGSIGAGSLPQSN